MFLVCSSQRSGIDVVHVSSMKSSMKFEFIFRVPSNSCLHTCTYDGNGWLVESQRGHLIGWRTGKLVVRFVTLVRDFSVCFVSVEADVVMCFGSVGVCMTPPPYSNLLGQ